MPEERFPRMTFRPVDIFISPLLILIKSCPPSSVRETLFLSCRAAFNALNVISPMSRKVCLEEKVVNASNRQSLNKTGTISFLLIAYINFLGLLTSPVKILSPNHFIVSKDKLGVLS